MDRQLIAAMAVVAALVAGCSDDNTAADDDTSTCTLLSTSVAADILGQSDPATTGTPYEPDKQLVDGANECTYGEPSIATIRVVTRALTTEEKAATDPRDVVPATCEQFEPMPAGSGAVGGSCTDQEAGGERVSVITHRDGGTYVGVTIWRSGSVEPTDGDAAIDVVERVSSAIRSS